MSTRRPPNPTSPPSAPTVPGAEMPLLVAEQVFVSLTSEPNPLAVDGRLLEHGLPARPIALDELRAMLLHPATGLPARDTAWRLLVGRARIPSPQGDKWVVGAVGVALPALRSSAARLYRSTGHADVQAELLAGFVTALREIDLGPERVCARLCNAAFVAARASVRAEDAERAGRVDTVIGPARPPVPWGHPDLVLARAVSVGVITAHDAEVIGVTRLEGVTLAEYAARTGASYEAVKRCRARAEKRLVAAIRDGMLSDTDVDLIREATLTYRVELGGHPHE
jgi:predicted DNA-binding protein (UPF0251 family)